MPQSERTVGCDGGTCATERVGYTEKASPVKKRLNRGFDAAFSIRLPSGPVRHEVVRNLVVLEALGGTVQDSSLELRLTERDRDFATRLLANIPVSTRLIGLGIGAQSAGRRWPLQRYAECVNQLLRQPCGQPLPRRGRSHALQRHLETGGLGRAIAIAHLPGALACLCRSLGALRLWLDTAHIPLTMRGTIAINLACVLMLMLFGRTVIRLWAGPAAVPTMPLLLAMGVWAVISGFMSVESCLLAALNRTGEQALLSIAAAVVNIVLSIALVRPIGSVGVIGGTILSYLLVLVVPQSMIVRGLFKGELSTEEERSSLLVFCFFPGQERTDAFRSSLLAFRQREGRRRLNHENYEDLEVWQGSHALTIRVYRITDSFPRSEMFGLMTGEKRIATRAKSELCYSPRNGFVSRSWPMVVNGPWPGTTMVSSGNASTGPCSDCMIFS